MKRPAVEIDSRAANLRPVVAIDDVDSRREIWRLLGYPGFDDRKRLDFVRWCTRRSGDALVKVSLQNKAKYTVVECVNDVLMLGINHGLDLNHALTELTRRVRRL